MLTAIEPVAGLYISDVTATRSPDTLHRHAVTHVISCTSLRDCPQFTEELGIAQLHVDIEDNPYEDLLMSLDGICAWIDHALEPAGEPECGVLVHCVQGISRSGAVIIAYLMRKRNISYEVALHLAQQSRAVVLPNSGFADQLRLWQQMGFTIYENASQAGREHGKLKLKQQYEDWRANRGVLLSRAQEVKQRETRDKMMNLAVQFGKQDLEGKKMGDKVSNTGQTTSAC